MMIICVDMVDVMDDDNVLDNDDEDDDDDDYIEMVLGGAAFCNHSSKAGQLQMQPSPVWSSSY